VIGQAAVDWRAALRQFAWRYTPTGGLAQSGRGHVVTSRWHHHVTWLPGGLWRRRWSRSLHLRSADRRCVLTSRSSAIAANVDCFLTKSSSGLPCIAAEIS